MVTTLPCASSVFESGSLSLPEWVFANVGPVVTSFIDRKRKYSEAERMAQPSSLLESVLCLPWGFQTAAIMDSCSPLQPWGGCKASNTGLKDTIVQERTLNSYWILSPYLNSKRICEVIGFAQGFWEFRAVHVVEMLKYIVSYGDYKSGSICIYTQSQPYFQTVDLNPVTLFVKGQTFVHIRMSLTSFRFIAEIFLCFIFKSECLNRIRIVCLIW